MPRRARQKSGSGIYHVMLRGNNRSTIFHDDEDCEKFLQVLGAVLAPAAAPAAPSEDSPSEDGSFVPRSACDEKAVPSGVSDAARSAPSGTCYLYCLMGNHAHLLMREEGKDLSALMKQVGVRFAAYYNWKYQRTGHLFQDRFRSEPVNDDEYFLSVYRYIAWNPVKAGLCGRPGDYRWCSYRRGTPPAPPLPMDLTSAQIDGLVLSQPPDIHPFPERLSDREAERILLEITGLPQAEEFQRLTRAEQLRLSGLLVENDLSIQQIARLTGTSKSRLARDLKHR